MKTQTIPLSSVTWSPGRQRQDFDSVSILELANSIKAHGLFHAIVVQPDGQTLVAGERRLRAIRDHLVPFGIGVRYGGEQLPVGHIPVVPVGTNDPLALEEIELDENFRREDLTWQEHAAAVARLHALRQAQQARLAPLVEGGPAPVQTVADTAREVRGSSIGEAQNATRLDILLAPHLNRPEVAAAKSAKEAFKVLKKLEDGERNRVLAAAVGETYTAREMKVFNANCINWMQEPEWQGKFDVILTDPPYGMGADSFGDGAGHLANIEHHYDDSYQSWQILMANWCALAYKVAKPQAHAYVFCDLDNFHELRVYMREAGWYVFRTPLINVKTNSGRVPLPDKGPRRQYEILLYAIKGDKLTNAIYPDVITSEADEQMSHGAQKPVSLYENLLRRSVKPGDWVLDTFAGTGTILASALAFKCYAVAVEQNPEYYGMCVKRLHNLDPQEALL